MQAETTTALTEDEVDWRYAPLTLNIRSQRHHRGAYLYANVEICAADPRYTLSTTSSPRISPLKSPWLPMWRTNLVQQILRFAQNDRKRAASMVTKERSVYGDKKWLRLFR